MLLLNKPISTTLELWESPIGTDPKLPLAVQDVRERLARAGWNWPSDLTPPDDAKIYMPKTHYGYWRNRLPIPVWLHHYGFRARRENSRFVRRIFGINIAFSRKQPDNPEDAIRVVYDGKTY